MIRRNRKLKSVVQSFVFLSICCSLLVACKEKPAAPPAPTRAPMPQKTGNNAAATQSKPVQSSQSSAKNATQKSAVQSQNSTIKIAPAVSLDFTSRRDPFKPFIQKLDSAQSAKTAVTSFSSKDALPIQTFDTDKFKVAGIITGVKENSALVLDPTGKGYVVKKGMNIGNSEGVIKAVTANSVEVEERFMDDNGRFKKRIVKLSLIRKK